MTSIYQYFTFLLSIIILNFVVKTVKIDTKTLLGFNFWVVLEVLCEFEWTVSPK